MIAATDIDGGDDTAPPKRIRRKVENLTVEQVAERRMAQRLTEYRALVARAADGEQLDEHAMADALDLLEQLHLPGFAFTRDTEAFQRYRLAQQKLQGAIDAKPAAEIRAAELKQEIDTITGKLAGLREQLHQAHAKVNKPQAYALTVQIMEAEHPHLLDTMERAVAWRLEQQRKRLQAAAGEAIQ
jgi:hypothetical protein